MSNIAKKLFSVRGATVSSRSAEACSFSAKSCDSDPPARPPVKASGCSYRLTQVSKPAVCACRALDTVENEVDTDSGLGIPAECGLSELGPSCQ
jgi:hypothetical protein